MRISLPASLTRHAVIPRRVTVRSTMATSSKLTLYSNPRTRSQIVEWYKRFTQSTIAHLDTPRYLKELGAPFDSRDIDMANKEHKSDWFLANVNPFGKLPALQDGDVTLFESGAILLYLAETLGGADTAAKRAELSKWILFANSTMSTGLFFEQFRESQTPVCLQPLEDILSKQPYLTGDSISAADIAVGANLLYLPMFVKDFDLSGYPALAAYCTRLQEREACPMKLAPAAA